MVLLKQESSTYCSPQDKMVLYKQQFSDNIL